MLDERAHEVDVADTVFEGNEIGARVGELANTRGGEASAVAVVDEHAEVGGRADALHMLDEAALVELGEVRRKQEKAVGARGLGVLGHLDGRGGAVARRSEYRAVLRPGVDSGPHHPCDLVEGEREELSRTAGRGHGRWAVLGEEFEVRAIAGLVELQFGGRVGDRETGEAGGQLLLEFDGREPSHGHFRGDVAKLVKRPGDRRLDYARRAKM